MLPEDDATIAWLMEFVATESQDERVEAWVDRVAGAVVAGSPELARDPDLGSLLHATVREQWQAFLGGLAGPTGEPTLLPSAERLATELARRRHELPVLLTAYRLAQREAWTFATEIAREAPAEMDRAAVLAEIWSQAGDWLDHATGASILVHQEEQRRMQRSGTARRFEAVRALLAGEDPGAREQALALGGYSLASPHTAVVLRALSAAATAQLEPTALAIAATAVGRPLLVEPGGRELWLWLPSAEIPLPADLRCGADVLVAVGGGATGPAGFRSTHEEALAALRLALAQPRPAAVTAYVDVAALTFLAQDPAAANRFVRRTLGPLAEDAPGHDRLRETLRVYLTSAGVEEAATALAVHKNTVRYRIAQVEERLGHAVSARRGDLELALRYREAFPAPPSR